MAADVHGARSLQQAGASLFQIPDSRFQIPGYTQIPDPRFQIPDKGPALRVRTLRAVRSSKGP